MKNKEITNRLLDEGLSPTDLTKEELDLLQKEIQTEEEGGVVLDGVLSPSNIRKIKERKGFC